VLATLAPAPAAAHPHVFVDYTVKLAFSGDRITGVRLTWTFDDLFSGFLLQEFDQDRNGAFSASEIQQIEAKHMSEFRRVAYYTSITVDGKPIVVPDARDFRASAAKGLVTYEFTLPISVPLASTTTIEIYVDDPVYYIAYLPAPVAPPTQTVGPYTVDCRVVPDKTGVTPDLVRCGVRRR
jgi:ABC-type uncharacterized transport system substrate-binding protein